MPDSLSPIISIIIPAFNAEKYLARCLNSILSQTRKEIEIVLIDDGSTDGTANICDEYSAKYSFIRVVHKTNGGASSARNIGLDMSLGEWIVFIDADDYITGDFIPTVLISDYDMYVQNWKFAGEQGQTEFLDAQIVSQNQLSAFLQAYFHWDLFRSVCSKFIKKSIVDQFHIRFDNHQRLGEDTLFFMDYIRYCQQIKVLDSGIYVYDRQIKDWKNKYTLSLDSVLSFYRSFLERYDRLPIPLPKLAGFEFYFFAGLLCERDKKKSTWRFSKTVLRMKELTVPISSLSFLSRLKFYFCKIMSLALHIA